MKFAIQRFCEFPINLIVLASNQSKSEKMNQLIGLAEINVDIDGIGMYTLGKYRKSLSEDQIKEYEILFRKYFLKSSF